MSRVPSERRAALALLAVVGLLVYFDTTLCPTAGIFGIPCPSCGLTRATLALVTGHLQKAYRLHPAVVLVVPYLLVASLLGLRGKGLARTRLLGTVGLVLLVVLVVLWVARYAGYFGGPVPVHPWSEVLRGTLTR